jgi:hypothetical protein
MPHSISWRRYTATNYHGKAESGYADTLIKTNRQRCDAFWDLELGTSLAFGAWDLGFFPTPSAALPSD